MVKTTLGLLLGGALLAAPVVAVAKEPISVQVPLGGDGSEAPHLGFAITKVYEAQQPTPAGHADGGSWQFFDAQTSDGAAFTFGFFARPTEGDLPMSFGDASLATPDRARLAASLAKGFRLPKPAASKGKGVPLRFKLVVLGRHGAKLPGGGYSDGGQFVTTKLFVEAHGKQAEVFFNFDLVGKTGEFSQKDASYDKLLVSIAASAL